MSFLKSKKEGPGRGVISDTAGTHDVRTDALTGATSAEGARPDGQEALDSELVAVIAAAVRAYESADEYSSILHIGKINRIAGTRPAWGEAGTTDAIRRRR